MKVHLNRQAFEAIIVAFKTALEGVGVATETIEDATKILTGQGCAVTREEASRLANREPLENLEIVTREKAAKLLGCDIRTVDWYRRTKKLDAVYLPNTCRARGFTRASVLRVLRGEIAKSSVKTEVTR